MSAAPPAPKPLEIPDLGADGAARLRAARVQVVGAGPIAAPALAVLAQAGVRTIFLDDAADARPEDAGWVYGVVEPGVQRPVAAVAPLRALAPALEVRLWSSEANPTAVLACTESDAAAMAASDRARVAGIPAVVALAGKDGGEVVAIPPGAPCFRCASPPVARYPAGPTAPSVVGTLAALELVFLVAKPALPPAGRRIELAAGWPSARPTERRPGCVCERSAPGPRDYGR